MASPHRVFVCLATLTILFSTAALWGAKDFVAPKASNASAYACKDTHPTEHVAAAVDVYNNSPKADIFITHFSEEGILPVFLIITNDGDQPIVVKNMQAEMVTARRSKLESLDVDDVLRRVAHIKGNSTNPNPHAGPIPLPGGTKNKKAQQQYAEITGAKFTAAAVEPHSTQSGFLFFDVLGVSQPVDGAHVYLTGIRNSNGNELMYFEIALTPSNGAAPGAK
ncbi:MAG: hypothetical protein ABSD63_06840 [Candidatus Korobacteraceae bacterium]|jgi:hypothetical protein